MIALLTVGQVFLWSFLAAVVIVALAAIQNNRRH